MNQKEILKSMKLFLFDMDGPLYLGSRLYDFTIELLESIKNGGQIPVYDQQFLQECGRLYQEAEQAEN